MSKESCAVACRPRHPAAFPPITIVIYPSVPGRFYGLRSHRLWLLGLLLLASSVLVGCGDEDVFSAWSPDGTKIAFDSRRDGNFEIYVMNADGTNPTRLH